MRGEDDEEEAVDVHNWQNEKVLLAIRGSTGIRESTFFFEDWHCNQCLPISKQHLCLTRLFDIITCVRRRRATTKLNEAFPQSWQIINEKVRKQFHRSTKSSFITPPFLWRLLIIHSHPGMQLDLNELVADPYLSQSSVVARWSISRTYSKRFPMGVNAIVDTEE